MIRRDLGSARYCSSSAGLLGAIEPVERRLPGALVGERGLDPVSRVAGHVRQPQLATQPDRGVVDRLEQQPGPDGHLVAVGCGPGGAGHRPAPRASRPGPELAQLTLQPGRGLLGPAPGRLGLLARGALLGTRLSEGAPQGGHLGLQRVERLLVAAPQLAQRPLGLVGAVAEPLLALLLARARLGGPLRARGVRRPPSPRSAPARPARPRRPASSVARTRTWTATRSRSSSSRSSSDMIASPRAGRGGRARSRRPA